MIADYYTKPLQGNLFKKLRNYIMGITIMPIEERIENNIKIKNNNETIDKTVNGYKPSYSDIVTGKMENNAENSIKLNVE